MNISLNLAGFGAFNRPPSPPLDRELDPAPPTPPVSFPPLRPESIQSLRSPTSPPFSPSRAPIRRKPLPAGAKTAPLAPRTPISSNSPASPAASSQGPRALEAPAELVPRSVRPFEPTSLQSPTLPRAEAFVARDLDRFPRPVSHNQIQIQSRHGWATEASQDILRKPLPKAHDSPSSPLTPSHARITSESTTITSSPSSRTSGHRRSSSASTMAVSPSPIKTQHHQSLAPSEAFSLSEIQDPKPPKSPSNRFTTFFKWGSTSEQGSRASVSSVSPGMSPMATVPPPLPSKAAPPAIDVPLANTVHAPSDSGVSMYPPFSPSSMEAIEDEVRIVAADLAASIKREMELEDLIEELQAEAAERDSGAGRRTSDYFSDAGTPGRLDLDSKPDYVVEKVQRKAEQEKSQLRLELLGKVQEERDKRKAAEAQVRELEGKAAKSGDSAAANARIRELEVALEDARRKLAEERQMKENFEDLLAALKEQLSAQRNERDNLRDDIVPRLRARVDRLESEASTMQAMSADHSRMQQDLMNLRNENASLAQRLQSRSRSETRGSRPGSPISSPMSPQSGMALNPKDRESLEKRLKDVEQQRDALHQALKSLTNRQQYESRKNMEKIKMLEMERDKAIGGPVGREGRRDREVSSLRREVERLRKRADDAIEQKYVCERNLGTLQMDLQKAEQETGTLRVLLQEHDTLITEHTELQLSHVRLSQQLSEIKQDVEREASSVSLQQAYRDLREVYDRSLTRLDELEANNPNPSDMTERERRLSESNQEAKRHIEKLRRSLTEAEIDRDAAVAEAEGYKKRVESLQKAEQLHISEERALSTQLRLSTERIEEMAAQVRVQLQSNDRLRERLANAISRGEEEQKLSAKHINELQARLKVLEDHVLEAQHAADDAVARHEAEIRAIRETHTSQLRRLKADMRTPNSFSPKSPLSPLLKSPRLEWTSKRISKDDKPNTDVLEKRVQELEKALTDADEEMAEVVSRMNAAQIEVLELQSERDEAARQTRRLQTQLVQERAKYSASS